MQSGGITLAQGKIAELVLLFLSLLLFLFFPLVTADLGMSLQYVVPELS